MTPAALSRTVNHYYYWHVARRRLMPSKLHVFPRLLLVTRVRSALPNQTIALKEIRRLIRSES